MSQGQPRPRRQISRCQPLHEHQLIDIGVFVCRACSARAGRGVLHAQWPLVGGFTPPVGKGLGGGIKLPEVGGVLVVGRGVGDVGAGVGDVGRGVGDVAVGGGATKFPEVGGIALSPPVPAVPPATSTPPSAVFAGVPALLGGGATRLPEVAGSCTQAAT